MGPQEAGLLLQAEKVCQLALLGVCTSLPFEEGILHFWIGGSVRVPIFWVKSEEGVRGGQPTWLPFN